LILSCVQDGIVLLDEPVGHYKNDAPEPNATIRQILTHTNAAGAFSYRPERYEPLSAVIRACRDDSYRETLANQLDRLAMVDAVPGSDVVTLKAPAEGLLPDNVD